MSLLSLYSKIQLKIEKVKKEIARSSCDDNGMSLSLRGRYDRSNPDTTRKELNGGIAASALLSLRSFSLLAMTVWFKLRLLFWQVLKTVVRVFCLVFGDSSENFLIFTKLGKDSVFVCNNSYCQYKTFQKRVRFYSKTAFAGILICTVITTSILYFMMPGKPSSFAATYNWVQSGWGGSVNTTTFPNHTSNQTNWTDYYAKDSEVVVDGDGDLKLDYATGSWTETSSGDFGEGDLGSATVVNGTGDGASVELDLSLFRPPFDCTGETDHGGADWMPNNGEEIYGKHYNIGTFTVVTGTTVYVKAYSGGSYGTLEIEADTINIIGTLNGDGKGYLGGAGVSQGDGQHGTGNNGSHNRTDGAGQGGSGHSTSYGNGGSGGGYGNLGGDGGKNFYGDVALGGEEYESADSYENKMGAGAGAGSGGGNNSIGGFGGGGGAGMLLSANNIVISGSIRANGENGGNGTGSNSYAGGGGGGTGGTIVINAETFTGEGEILVQGGNGGNYGGHISTGGGGGGAGGRIKIFYTSLLFIGNHFESGGTGGTGGNNGQASSGEAGSLGTYYSEFKFGVSTPSTFTSQIHSVEDNQTYDTMTWVDSGGQTITMKARTSNSETMSGATDWGSCGTITKGADITDVPATNNCVTDGHQYIQYQATLSTDNTAQTPSLESVTINYTLTTYLTGGPYTLTSSPYNTDSSENVLSGIEWTEDLPIGGGWQYRKPITISPVTPEANYQIKIELTSANFDYAKAETNGEDLRFYQTDETTQLDYWIETWNDSGNSVIWVEVANSGSGGIYMYYGKSGVSARSNGINTFEFFDDFNRADSDIVGNGWLEAEETTMKTEIVSNEIRQQYDSGSASSWQETLLYRTDPWISGNYIIGARSHWDTSVTLTAVQPLKIEGASGSAMPYYFSNHIRFYVGGEFIEDPRTGHQNHNYNIYKFGNNYKVYEDNDLKIERTSDLGITQRVVIRNAQFMDAQSAVLYVDDFYVCKYTVPEPVPSIGSETSGSFFAGVGSDIKFQLRTGSSSTDILSNDWCGPNDGILDSCDTTTYFTDPTGLIEVIDTDFTIGDDDQWVQYKVYLSSVDGFATPTLSDVTTVYVINAPPVITNVTTADSATDGIIDINYTISDEEEGEEDGEVDISFLANTGTTLNEDLLIGDATAITVSNINQLPSASVEAPRTIQIDKEQIIYTGKSGDNLTGITRGSIAGNNTKAASHDPGAIIWIKGTTVTGDVGTIMGVNNTPTAKTGTWNIKTDLDGICYANAIIRVTANDGNSANQVGHGDSATYILDVKDPELGGGPIVIDASAGIDSVILTLNVSDDTALYMMISNNASLTSDGVNALSTGDWVAMLPYKVNPGEYIVPSWILESDPDTVYVQFKDSKENIGGGAGAIQSMESLPAPENFMIQDISNLDASEFREFIAWKASTISDFQDYILESSTDDISYTTLQTITNQALNYHTHPSLILDQDYYYRVCQQDTLGNKSLRTATKHGRANGAQDFDEGGGGTAAGDDLIPPTITHNHTTQVTNITATTATITFTTNEMSDSYIGYSTNTTYANEQGVPTMIAGGEDHIVELIGLTENTPYHYKIKSRDASGNVGESQDDINYVFTTTTDNTSPIITFNPDDVTTTDSTATIIWTTDEAADSRVDYGEDTSYGSNELNTNYNIDHSITLTNLTPETIYHYKLTSVDNSISDNFTETIDYTLTTLVSTDITPPAISNVSTNSLSYNSIAITWNTDENSNSLIDFGTEVDGESIPLYGTTQGNSSTDPIDITQSHSVTLTGLAPSTTYYYKIKSMDMAGNIGFDDKDTEEEYYEFTTESAPDPGDTTAPEISNVSHSVITSTGVTISWNTNENSDSTAGFSVDPNTSYNTEQGSTEFTNSHSITLVNLAPNTTYNYQVKSRDDAGNLGSDGGHSFTTLEGGDELPPDISGVTISDLTAHTAKISWNTNENSSSLIDYSQNSGVFTSTTGKYQDDLTVHSVTMRGLDPSTTYYFQVRSIDASGNEGKDSDGGSGYTFITTAGGDETPPEITNIITGTPTYNSVTISWDTNELSSSLIDFGTNTSYGTTQGNSADSEISHSVTLTGLIPETLYYYRIKSIDVSGNLVSDDNNGAGWTFTTAAGLDPGDIIAPTIIFNSETGITNITSNSATISWTTEDEDNIPEAADSTIGYSLDTSFNTEKGSPEAVTNHIVTLTNLSAGTIYKFQIKSMDESGNLATENNTGLGYTFETLAGGDSTAPIISNVSTGTCADTYCVVSWNTDENSSSLVDYGEIQGTFTSTGGNYKDEVTAHSVTLTSLTPETTYYYRVRSVDNNDNQAIDAGGANGYSLTTTATEEEEEPECPTCPSCGGGRSCPSVDTTPPVISGIEVSEIGTGSVVVEWETGEDSDSFVEFGISSDYDKVDGSRTATKKHSITLNNLESNTAYYYKVTSADSSGNLAQSSNQTFTTLNIEDLPPAEQEEEIEEQQETTAEEIQAKIEELLTQGMDEEEIRAIIARASQPPVIATAGPIIDNLTNNSAKIAWTTDRKSNSVIRFKAKEENIDPESSSALKQYGDFKELTVAHQVILSNLQSGTTYQYQVQSSDVLGNTGKSDWNEFTTNITPSIYDVLISEITLNSAVISWKTNIVSSSKVEYGETISYSDNIEDKDNTKVAKHIIKLNNLQSGTLYHFRVRGIDAESNNLVSDDYSFTTYTLPQIETYTVEEISERVIKLNWKTNVETDSAIKYTNLETNITKIQGEDGMSSIHNFTLKGLTPGIEYLLQIQGRDIYGNQAITSEFIATTLKDDTPPKISQVRTETAISSGKSDVVQTIISWKTNELATSQILWEEGISKDETPKNSTVEDENHTTNHIIVITSFKPSSVYRFRIQGKDKADNIAQSQDFTILIPEKKKSVIQIIISNFEDTFGWVKKLGG